MWRRRRRDEDFRDEIEAHLTLEADRLAADGVTADEARAAARRAFGSRTRVQEQYYEAGRILWLDDLRRELAIPVPGTRRRDGD